MKQEITQRGHAYAAVKHIYDNSPGRSWARLNGALSSTLDASITAHLSFLPDDFSAMFREMSGGYWMGNSSGDQTGEAFYSHAVKVGHTAACISFEKFAGRPAAMWPEKVKTPARLCIGSSFTWDGVGVTVTNMRVDHLIACSYKYGPYRGNDDHQLAHGDLMYAESKQRKVEDVKRSENGDLLIRLGEIVPHGDSSKIERRFQITYDELAEKRKEFDVRRNNALSAIAAIETPEALVDLTAELNLAGVRFYRHFDIEAIREAITAKRNAFSDTANQDAERLREASQLQRWQTGESVPAYFKTVSLRIRGEFVETSTGQSVHLASAQALLPWVIKNRERRGPIKDKQVDLHEVRTFTDDGVQIGCTLVPWSEVDRLSSVLKVGCAA